MYLLHVLMQITYINTYVSSRFTNVINKVTKFVRNSFTNVKNKLLMSFIVLQFYQCNEYFLNKCKSQHMYKCYKLLMYYFNF